MNAYDVAGLVMHGRPDPNEKLWLLCELVVYYRSLAKSYADLVDAHHERFHLTEADMERLELCVAVAKEQVAMREAALGVGP